MNASNPTPPPPGVPADARFNASAKTWVQGQIDSEARPHGMQLVYDESGALVSEMSFEHGQPHGPFKRFHPNGELARSGQFERGQLSGEVIAYACSEPSPELLRACCVPAAARSLKMDYIQGRRLSETFFDEDGRRLLDDGSLYPERPEAVDEGARYIAQAARWVVGESDDERRRHGMWKWWSLEGEPQEDAHYVHGKRHGVSRFYVPGAVRGDDAELRQFGEFDHGLQHGRWFERFAPGFHGDVRIASRKGQFRAGRMFGTWTYADAAGECVHQVNLGEPLSERDVADLILGRAQIEQDSAEATLHRVVASGDAVAVLRFCEQHTACLSVTSSTELLAQIRKSKASWEQQIAKLSHALLSGAEPSAGLRQLSSMLIAHPEIALRYVNIAIALDETSVEALATRTLIRLELADVEGADADVARVEQISPPAAEQLSLSRRALFPNFDFWPDQVELGEHTSDELPTDVAQPLDAIQSAVAKAARRLCLLQEGVRQQVGQVAKTWLSPELDLPKPAVELASYVFEASGDEESDTVVVDELIDVEGEGVGQLMKRIRVEWTTLCWLCWGAGMNCVGWPERLAPPATFPRAIVTAFQRHWRVQDRIQTSGLRARVQRVAGFSWEGTPVDQLGSVHSQMALAEQLEMRAVLFFLGDASCRSVWQDDLRA